ncbi:MAG: adenosylcobinamide-GDP ribazoletransferase [Pseudomonadota bacterium]
MNNHPLRLLLTAVQFYTRVPVPQWVGHSEAQLAAATPYFPLVGIGIGLVTGLVFELACIVFEPLIAAVLALGFGVLLTGAFHEDGFADVCDGFGGGYTKERVLEIMKDSRVGAFGAIGIGLLLLLQGAALAGAPPQTGAGLMVLVSAHAFSRALALLVAWWLPYVREDASSKARPVVTAMAGSAVLIALVIGVMPLALHAIRSSPTQALAAFVLAMLATAWCARWFRQRLGGYTGDCLGAAQQVAFTAMLLGFAARV